MVMRVPSSRGYLAVRISSGWISTLPSSACASPARIRDGSKLRRSDRIVQKCRSDQIFQIVVRLLFGPGSVLGTEGAATGDVEAGLKDITQDALDVVCRQAVVAFELENGCQHGLTMDERTVLLQDSLFDDFQGIVGPIDIDLLVKHPLHPVRAFDHPRWSGEAALGERCRTNRAHARHPR